MYSTYPPTPLPLEYDPKGEIRTMFGDVVAHLPDALVPSYGRAMAAGPVLLKACKQIEAHWAAGNFSRSPELLLYLRSAIALAEGDGD
jgi:hypothetical protein